MSMCASGFAISVTGSSGFSDALESGACSKIRLLITLESVVVVAPARDGSVVFKMDFILRLVIVLPFLQDRSQLQLQFGGTFIDLNSMLELLLVVVSSSAKWSISRLVPLRSSSVLSSPSK